MVEAADSRPAVFDDAPVEKDTRTGACPASRGMSSGDTETRVPIYVESELSKAWAMSSRGYLAIPRTFNWMRKWFVENLSSARLNSYPQVGFLVVTGHTTPSDKAPSCRASWTATFAVFLCATDMAVSGIECMGISAPLERSRLWYEYVVWLHPSPYLHAACPAQAWSLGKTRRRNLRRRPVQHRRLFPASRSATRASSLRPFPPFFPHSGPFSRSWMRLLGRSPQSPPTHCTAAIRWAGC